ncbi:HlyD family efflux transporter periplasmic adaptor subunit [Aliamphritea spongicola]|uniref:HlyD family efflux transporter periplasmic adaptor subunit n=1 Tax=Aliamphritea spongicola TaxID=707589 RepID=UPI00196AB744|nr:HlyD family efflux transporter periplasmic adaptor subunit [Aliamphritea spongicola]MBN3562577.1 efflux RND transporter periplasmic adaptor subunit [Aliamphritea spongicola]
MNEQISPTESHPLTAGVAGQGQINTVQEEYYGDWLAGQDHLIDGLLSALILVPVEGTLVQAATLENTSQYFYQLMDIALEQVDSDQPQVASLGSSEQGEVFALVYPLRDTNSEMIALIAMAVGVSREQDLHRALAVLQWSVAGIEVVDYQHRLQQLSQDQHGIAERVDILARVMAEPDYPSAAVRLVTELAVLFNCDRVSLGEYKHNRSRLKHLSHSTQFGKRMNLVRCIEQVMDESLDQGQSIRFPQPDATAGEVVLAHRNLSEQQGDACVLSIPLYLHGEAHGALVLEGNPDVPFTDEQAELCQSIASLVMPALEDKRLNDRPLWRKCADSAGLQLSRLLGAGYLGRKLIVLGLLALTAFLYTATGPYRLSAEARINSAIQRAVVAPYDGYIESATARAGDEVEAGQVLIHLDDRDLRLERLKWLSEKAKLNRQYQEALSVRDRAKINIISAQQSQVDAQLELVTGQLARAQLTAPFDGLVVSGDLSQRLGSAVSKGEELLAVSPLHRYRIHMLVKESRIADVALEQSGTLHLSALPETPFEFTLSKITPLTEARDGATYFIVEGELLSGADQLQPGMEGIAKISIDERKLIDIWSRETLEWLRLRLWAWWG